MLVLDHNALPEPPSHSGVQIILPPSCYMQFVQCFK